MAIRVKSGAAIADKYVARASAAGGDYNTGVQNPRRDQAEAAAAAKDSYAAGVQAAISDNRFEKGVRAAGSDKWRRKASTVGASRFPTGIQAAKGDFQNGVQPFLDTIASLELQPRFPKGDPRNFQRVTQVATALRQKKLEG